MNLQKALWLIGILLFVTLASWLVYTLRSVLTPFLLAFLMAYILNPVIQFGVRRNLSRDFCIALLMLVLLVGLIVAGVGLVPLLMHQVATLGDDLPRLGERVTELLTEVELRLNAMPVVARFYPHGISLQPPTLAGVASGMLPQVSTVVGVAGDWSRGVFSGLYGAGMFVFFFGLFIISTIYLLRDYDRIVLQARELVPRRQEALVLQLLNDIDRNLRNFFRGQLLVCLINSSVLSLVLYLAGVPYALLIGFLTGFLNIIPYLGVSLGLLLALTVNWLTYGDAAHVVYVLAAFAVQQALDAGFVTPRLLGDTVGLHPVAVIASFLIFGKLFGFFGVLLAVPLSTVAKVLLGYGLRLYKTSWVYGDSVPPTTTGGEGQ